MPDAEEKLTPATRSDLETCLSLALTSGRALARSQPAEVTAKVVAERLVVYSRAIWLRDHAQAYRRRTLAAECAGVLAAYEARLHEMTVMRGGALG
jgi:hypothetical protein